MSDSSQPDTNNISSNSISFHEDVVEVTMGPAFESELKTAGVSAFSYGIDYSNKKISFGSSITPEQRKEVIAVIEVHDPTKPAPPVVPVSIPLYKAKIVLATTDMPDGSKKILTAANEFIEGIADPQTKLIAQTAFSDAPELFRSSPTLATVIAELKLPDNLVDQLFIEAESLKV